MSTFEETVEKSFDIQQTKKNIKEQNQQSLTIAVNGGLFKITPELIMFANMFTEQKEIVLEDSYGNPVKITDVHDFVYKCKIKYHEVMNNWLAEYDQAKSIRKPQ